MNVFYAKPLISATVIFFVSGMATAVLVIGSPAHAQSGPPTIGQETKGTPAYDEEAPLPETTQTAPADQVETQEPEDQTGPLSILGSTKITESRRENGQIYEVELEHSSGSKQYIQETDSDGKIESKSNDLEETPNLPKWKLGSW